MAGPFFSSGQKIEDYLIEKQLTRGGMADVYLATDIALKRKVIIKIINTHSSNGNVYGKQFLREARIQANLDNPHIVPIYRMFDYGPNLCLVMQRIKGTDLAKVVKKAIHNRKQRGKKGALSEERAVHIFLQILEGIGFMHKYNIIHGDIKPSNILLDKEGMVKVADFGLSSPLPSAGIEKDEIIPGGTPFYMSPEQILKEPVGLGTDIYSLGVTFFHMLTGEYPSGDRKKLFELLEFHVEGTLDEPKEMLEGFLHIRPRTRKIILKALEHDPGDRHKSCLEFSLAIKEEEPFEMYSEILRISLLSKSTITPEERAYLDKIALKRGLSIEDAQALEKNVRKEINSTALDFATEYRTAYRDIMRTGKERDRDYLDKLDEIYEKKSRISKEIAQSIREDLMSKTG